jgi:hypothetical protein
MRARTIGRIGPIAVEDCDEPKPRAAASKLDSPKGDVGETKQNEGARKTRVSACSAWQVYITENTTQLRRTEFWRGTATYTPDSNSSSAYNSATGTNTVTVTAAVAPSFTVSSTTAPQTVQPGSTATYSITVTPQNGSFSNTITLAASGLPPGATATFSPPSVTPGNSSASSTLTIQTAKTTAALTDRGSPWPLAAPALAVIGIFFLPDKKRRRRITLAVLAFASLGALSALTACGGGFGMIAPAATYNITITGTGGSVQQSTTVQLTVE